MVVCVMGAGMQSHYPASKGNESWSSSVSPQEKFIPVCWVEATVASERTGTERMPRTDLRWSMSF
jgi:hypothetical protein